MSYVTHKIAKRRTTTLKTLALHTTRASLRKDGHVLQCTLDKTRTALHDSPCRRTCPHMQLMYSGIAEGREALTFTPKEHPWSS